MHSFWMSCSPLKVNASSIEAVCIGGPCRPMQPEWRRPRVAGFEAGAVKNASLLP